MSEAISFDAVSKRYRAVESYRTLRDDMAGAARRVVSRRRSARGVLSALDDVSFEIPQGVSTALIGRNGAGKTTALKIICRITYPSAGVVRVRGRVGALLEVGTGMHPELSGRENIRIYGRILGHSRREISQRLEQIVDFAGIEAAIDQPVKQYSSGMQLRLGFSVAAHLDPDVLVVDEALAVGDAAFQHRCIERMGEIVREGRTLVFVSHDMSAVEALCDRAILLADGKVAQSGPAREVVGAYLQSVEADIIGAGSRDGVVVETGVLDILDVSIRDSAGREVTEVAEGDSMTVRLRYLARERIRRPIFTLGLSDGHRTAFSAASMLIDGQVPEELNGEGYLDCTFATLPLQPRAYEVWGEVRTQAGVGFIIDWQRLRRFKVVGEVVGEGRSALAHSVSYAPVKLPYQWRFGPVEGSDVDSEDPERAA